MEWKSDYMGCKADRRLVGKFSFCIISWHWNDTHSGRTCVSCIDNNMAADVQAGQGAMASAAMIFRLRHQNGQVYTVKQLVIRFDHSTFLIIQEYSNFRLIKGAPHIRVYCHFVQVLDIEMTQIVGILPDRKQEPACPTWQMVYNCWCPGETRS